MKLCRAALSKLQESVARPRYSHDQLTPGIVHIGVGNFHRAHQAVYLDDLFNQAAGLDFGIIGAGLRPADAGMRARLGSQDWLTTVVEVGGDEARAQIIGPMLDFLPVRDDKRELIAQLADPRIRIVTLTITEAGYFIDSGSGKFDTNAPEIIADLRQPEAPRSVFGILVAALKARRAAALPPFAVLSCDNLPHNGKVAREAVVEMTRLMAPDLASWVEAEAAFPSCMVDRVTPATSDRERQLVATVFGIEDTSPVVCEPFRQWVIEDHFPQGRPELEAVGVTFTNDVGAFELMKLRMLNAGHAILAYPASLLGTEFVHEAMSHKLIAGFMHKVIEDDVIPVVPSVPGVDQRTYLALIERRFANPEICDTISRICFDGANKLPKFILPSIRDRLAGRQSIDGLTLACALWCLYVAGPDASADQLMADALSGGSEASPTNIFGDLGTQPAFRSAFSQSVAALCQDGVAATLARYVDGQGIQASSIRGDPVT